MKEVESLMKLRKYEEALRKLENAMLLCDNSLQFISPSEEKISKLKSEDLKGIPIQWRILRGEILLMNNDYDEAMKVAEIILNSPGNSKNSEAYALKTKLIYITGKSNIENAVRHLRRSLEYYNKNEKAKLLINKIKEIDEQKKLINDNYFKKKNFEEAIKQYDILIEECTNLYLTGTVLIILLRNKSTCLMEVIIFLFYFISFVLLTHYFYYNSSLFILFNFVNVFLFYCISLLFYLFFFILFILSFLLWFLFFFYMAIVYMIIQYMIIQYMIIQYDYSIYDYSI